MGFCHGDDVRGIRPVDRARPISSFPTGLMIGARRIVVDPQGASAPDGGMTFGPEEAVYVRTVARALPLPNVGELSVLRLEVSSMQRSERGPQVGDRIVIAGFPYSNFWVASAAFKKGRKRSRDDFPVLKATSLDGALVEIDDMPSDPWERGSSITAGFFGRKTRALADHRPRNVRDDEWVVGIVDAALEPLVNRLHSCVRALSLMARTRAPGQRVFRPAGATGRASSPIHPTAADNAPLLLGAAAHQALAGPRSNADPGPSGCDEEANDAAEWSWTGRPVMDLVERIFLNHLYNQSRGYERKSRRESLFASEQQLSYSLPF